MDTSWLGDLENHLRRGEFRPAYLLLGPETYLLRQAVERLKSSVVRSDLFVFNFAEFDASSTPMHEILAAARTFPMMSARRLVLVRQCELAPESERAPLLDYLADPSDRCVLVMTASEFDRRTSYFRTLRTRAHLVEYPRIKGAALERFVAEYLRSHGYRAPSSALRRLVEVTGTDLQALANEMDKLMIYAGADSTITEAAVDELAGAMRQRGIFELTGALGRRDVRAALQVLAGLLDAGEAPLMIVTMMARHYRQVLIAKEMLGAKKGPAEISEAAGIPPFVLDEFLRQAKSVDSSTARRLFARLADIDRKFKSTSADHRMVLEALICSI